MFLHFLGGVDKLPAFVEILSGRHFDCHVFALFHSVDSHRHMVVPIGADIYEIDVGTLTKFHPCRIADIFSSSRTAVVCEYVLRTLNAVGMLVAQRFD